MDRLTLDVLGRFQRLVRACLLDCQPKSKEDAVYVSVKWRDAVLMAAQASIAAAVPGKHFICPKCGAVDRFGSYKREGTTEFIGMCHGRDSSLIGCPAQFEWVRTPESDAEVGL